MPTLTVSLGGGQLKPFPLQPEYPIVSRLQLPGLGWSNCAVWAPSLWLRARLSRSCHLVCVPFPSTCLKKRFQLELTASRLPAHLPFICSWLSDCTFLGCMAAIGGQNSKDLWPPLMVSVIFLQAPSALLGRRVLQGTCPDPSRRRLSALATS